MYFWILVLFFVLIVIGFLGVYRAVAEQRDYVGTEQPQPSANSTPQPPTNPTNPGTQASPVPATPNPELQSQMQGLWSWGKNTLGGLFAGPPTEAK